MSSLFVKAGDGETVYNATLADELRSTIELPETKPFGFWNNRGLGDT